MAKIILLTGSFVAYAYAMEFFVAWYSGNSYERFAFWNRIFGPYWWFLVVWHAFLQLPFTATFLVQVVPEECVCCFLRLHVCERWNVV